MAIEQTPTEPDLRAPRRRRRELNSLLWLCGWGGFTAVALTALAIASQTETASERLRHIFAMNKSSAIARMPPRVTQLETETQRLAAQVRALTTDRDRLAGRIAATRKQYRRHDGGHQKAGCRDCSRPCGQGTSTDAKRTGHRTAGKSARDECQHRRDGDAGFRRVPRTQGRPGAPQAVPLPPARVATVSITGPDPPAAKQDDFGLDLGGGGTIDAVRQRWSTVKANFGPLLSGMHPLAAHDQRPGVPGYRLVVGPLPNSVAASGLCAHFSAARTACRPVKFDGEPIAQQ